MTMQRYRHDPSKNLVGFVVGDVEYAVAIARVKEIANPLTLVSLPHAPRAVIGVADYRGDLVPVVDLRVRFGLPGASVTRKTKWIVVDVGGAPRADRADGAAPPVSATRPPEVAVADAIAQRPAVSSGRVVALVVDAVTEVFGTGGSDLRAAPALGGGEDVRGIAGVASHAGNLVFVLDATRLRDLAEAALAIAPDASPHAKRLPVGSLP